MEQLEPRSLFSAPFAGVGVRFDPTGGPAAYEMVGQLADDGSVTGDSILAGLSGSAVSGPIDFAALGVLARGRMTATLRDGLDPYSQFNGTHFVRDRGYPLGSSYAVHGGGEDPVDISFFVERPSAGEITWFAVGVFEFQYFEISASGTSVASGTFLFAQGAGGGIAWSNSPDGSDATVIGVTTQDADGTLHLANGSTIFTSAGGFGSLIDVDTYQAGNVALIADTDNSDGRVGFGIARRLPSSIVTTGPIVHGVYRTNVLTAGAVGQEFFAARSVADGVAAASVVIDMDFRGQYRIYDMAAYDAGDRTVLSSGTWDGPAEVVAGRTNFLKLTSESGAAASFMVSFFDYSLVAFNVQSGAGSEQLIGSGTAFSGRGDELYTRGGHVALDDDGRPIFHQAIEQVNGDRSWQWHSYDLIDFWGGEPLVAVDSIQYEQANPVFIVLGVDADGEVHAWERLYTHRWIYRNLTDELGGELIVSDITVFRTHILSPSLAIAGKNAAGDLVLYHTPNGAQDRDHYGAQTWNAANITQTYLEPFDVATPVWSGPIQGYTTLWGAINIVGLNAEGEIEVAWTAPGLEQWHVNNISETAGTPTLTGRVSVFVTSWNAIHIHALDDQGQVHVTWWVPQFEGEWMHNNLTAETGGPTFDTTRVTDRGNAFTTFLADDQTFNISGFDSEGRLRVYWWNTAVNGWQVGDLTGSFPVESAPYTLASADVLGGPDPYFPRGQSLYGYNLDGTFSRMWWARWGPDEWHVENLSDVSIPMML